MLVSMSVDYRRACLAVRERFLLADEAATAAYLRFGSAGADSVVLAQTCNRLEAYAWWPDAETEGGHALLAQRMCRAWCGGEEGEEMARFAIVETGVDAVRHLLRVAAGLESQVLGDIHILAQLRRAYRRAVELGCVDSPLHRLFEIAFRLGKRVRRETALTSTLCGVGSEAARVVHALDALGDVVVVGCGKIGTQAAQTLVARGVRSLVIVNRTAHRAVTLAKQLGAGRGEGLDALPAALATARAVIVATDAREPVLTAEAVAAARPDAGGARRPLAIVDVSVPRNVDPGAGQLAGVELVDLDTLHPETSVSLAARRAAIPHAEALVAEACRDYLEWLDLATARAALHPLRAIIADVCRREIAFLTGESLASMRAADRIVARVLAHPMVTLRGARERGEDVAAPAAVLGRFFV